MKYRLLLVSLLFSQASVVGNSFVCPESIRVSSATVTLNRCLRGLRCLPPSR